MKLDNMIADGIENTLDERLLQYTADLKKLTFDKSKMPPIGKAVEALKNLHEILVRFEAYRIKQQNKE